MVGLMATLGLLQLSQDQIAFSEKEALGVRYIDKIRPVLETMPQHRGMTNGYLNGIRSLETRILSKRSEVDASLADLSKFDDEQGEVLNASAKLKQIKANWDSLKNQALNLTASESFSRHTAVLEEVIALIIHVGDQSNLILDPDLDSYYLMDLIVVKIPEATEKIGQMRGLGAGIISDKSMTQSQSERLFELGVYADIFQKGAVKSLQASFDASESVKQKMSANMAAIQLKPVDYGRQVKKITRGQYNAMDSKAFFTDGTDVIKEYFTLYDAASPMLMELLEKRIAGFEAIQLSLLIPVAVTSLIALLIAGFVIRNRSDP